jgi:hypothetical protein
MTHLTACPAERSAINPASQPEQISYRAPVIEHSNFESKHAAPNHVCGGMLISLRSKPRMPHRGPPAARDTQPFVDCR